MAPAKGYTEMKESGIEWLGKIPNNWCTIRVKYAFRIKKVIAGELGHTVLSVTQRGIKPKDMSEKGQFSLDYSKYQLVDSGDFIMNHMDLLTGWVDTSCMNGVTSPDYRVFQSSNPEKYYPGFYRYVFQTCYQQRIFYGLGQGVSGFGRWRLPAEIFLNFYVPAPPYEIQSAIASYLDAQCAKIDEIITQAKASIEDYTLAGDMLFDEINEIIASSKIGATVSKRCEKRIDTAILSHYNKAEIKRIKKKWNDSEIEPYFKKALGQTLDAYLRKEYALAIPFLATMWEGIIKSKVGKNEKKFKEKCKDLVDENGYDEVFSDFFNNLIFGQCYSVNDVVDGIPNRNGVAHSWYIKYPSQKAALNAILLTDFVLSLKPKNEAEDIEKE